MEDPDTLAPRYWQTVFPYPPAAGPDRRVEQVDRQLRTFARLAPDFPHVHPVTATSPPASRDSGCRSNLLAPGLPGTTIAIPSPAGDGR